MTTPSVALCLHFALEHYRGGEKWAAALANRLHEDGVRVEVRALPYAPGGKRRVSHESVLDRGIPYKESWIHDLSHVDRAYVMYAPGMRHVFRDAGASIAGIHSWAFVSSAFVESQYSALHNLAKLTFKVYGTRELQKYVRVHTVTPAFSKTYDKPPVYIPNFVDRERYRPDRKSLAPEFQVFVAAANTQEKGWDLARHTAAVLNSDIRVLTTGTSESPHVEGLGYLSEAALTDTYARSHVVLHPARVDTDSMVINEALATGTPVVTTPIETHVRENEAVIHAGTAHEMAYQIERLREEWRAGEAYTQRCRTAREMSRSRDSELVYPALKSLIFDPTGTHPTVDELPPIANE